MSITAGTSLTKSMELAHLENVQIGLFNLAVNKLVTDKTQNILITEHSNLIEYSLKKL